MGFSKIKRDKQANRNTGGKKIKNKTTHNNSLICVTLDEIVPEDHLVRKLQNTVNWSHIHTRCDPLYSDIGTVHVDPIILFKMMILNIIYGYYNMTQTCKEIEVNIAYRWFLGLSLYDKIPNRTTITQNYNRKFKENDLGIDILTHILIKLDYENVISLDKISKKDKILFKTKTNDIKILTHEVRAVVKHYLKRIKKDDWE